MFGHFGDRIGRKSMLVTSLLIMGVATFLIGCLPTFSAIGVAAPILLVVLRFAQGIGVGLIIRLKLMESPAFERVKETETQAQKPIIDVVRKYPRNVLVAMGMRVAENGCFYGDRAVHRAAVRRAFGPVRAAAAVHGRCDRHDAVGVPAVRAARYQVARADLACDSRRREPRPRPDVRTAGAGGASLVALYMTGLGVITVVATWFARETYQSDVDRDYEEERELVRERRFDRERFREPAGMR